MARRCPSLVKQHQSHITSGGVLLFSQAIDPATGFGLFLPCNALGLTLHLLLRDELRTLLFAMYGVPHVNLEHARKSSDARVLASDPLVPFSSWGTVACVRLPSVWRRDRTVRIIPGGEYGHQGPHLAKLIL
ncbi:hypothetical protein BJY52DRAFT_1227695 [Lactarius psammicola]|nr:hypothetical protein BJY52DRAFT_1227695 [Lactarius psammicola]